MEKLGKVSGSTSFPDAVFLFSSDSEKEQFVALMHLLLACGCVCPLGIEHLMLFAASVDTFPVNCALKKRPGLFRATQSFSANRNIHLRAKRGG